MRTSSLSAPILAIEKPLGGFDVPRERCFFFFGCVVRWPSGAGVAYASDPVKAGAVDCAVELAGAGLESCAAERAMAAL